MPSETDLLNDALGQIGATAITAIDDGSINAIHCSVFYPALRRSLLRSHFWNFAEARATLAQDTTPPLFEYAFAYTLPVDCLRLKTYNGANLNTSSVADIAFIQQMFKIEGRKIFTNDATVLIVYIKDEIDPNMWDALFYQAMAAALASKLATAITKDAKLSQVLLTSAMNVLMPQALAVDGQEGVVTSLVSDSLTWGR